MLYLNHHKTKKRKELPRMTNITQDMIIHTTEKSDGTSDTEIIENIHENSVGYVKAMELLTNFVRSDGKQVFIFASKLNNNK